MKAKKNNHEVGKSFLRAWCNQHNKIWLFDLEKQVIEERSNECTFAVEDYLYVPLINGKRDDSTEDWLSDGENALANFLRRIRTKDFSKPMSQKEFYLSMMGLIGLSYRSSYELKKIEQSLEQDEQLREQLGIDLSTPTARQRFSVENMINMVTKQTLAFIGGAVSVSFGTKKTILVCERPGFDMTPREYSINAIPVGPTAFVFMDVNGLPPAILHGPIFHEAGPEATVVDLLNNFTVKRARKWIVASTKEELELLRPLLTPEKIEERRKADKPNFIKLSEEERARGWRLRDEEENDSQKSEEDQ